MFITKMSLARRTFLRGMGATLALPMLESMVPAFASAASPIRRAGFIYMPLGAVMQQWTPAAAGTDFEYTPVLKPLEGMRQHLNVFTGLARPVGGTHANSAATWLTGVSPKKTVAEDVRVGTTIDQIVAGHIGGDKKEEKAASRSQESSDQTRWPRAWSARRSGKTCSLTLAWNRTGRRALGVSPSVARSRSDWKALGDA